jgi:hypothetical protein
MRQKGAQAVPRRLQPLGQSMTEVRHDKKIIKPKIASD